MVDQDVSRIANYRKRIFEGKTQVSTKATQELGSGLELTQQ